MEEQPTPTEIIQQVVPALQSLFRGMSRRQQLLLAVMASVEVVVICALAWVAIGLARGPEPIPVAAPPTLAPTPTPPPTRVPTPTPRPTPTPVPPPTLFDLDIARNPDDLDLRVRRGFYYIETLNAPEAALKDFEYVLERDPNHARAHYGRGVALVQLRRWSEALNAFGQTLALDAAMAEAYNTRGTLYLWQGRAEEALADFEQVVALLPEQSTGYLNRANALRELGRFEDALADYSRALQIQPDSTEALVGRALTYGEMGESDLGMMDLRRAAELGSSDPAVLSARAWYRAEYLGTGLEEAVQLAQRAVRNARDSVTKAMALDTLGWVYYKLERYEDALKALEEAAALMTVEGEIAIPRIREHLEAVRSHAP